MIKAAIFDMDGLLIDSEPFWRQSHREVLGRYGYIVTEDEVRAAAGKRTREQVELWHQRFQWTEPSVDGVTQEIVNNVSSLIHIHGEALPGVRHIINLLHKHRIPMAVASSSSQGLINSVMKKLDLKKSMKFAVSGEDEKRGKPFPDVFITAANKLNVQPQNCLVFEDSLNGIRAAKAAGMKCIAVPEKENSNKPEFDEADIVINSLEDLRWETIVKLWSD